MARAKSPSPAQSTATIGFEAKRTVCKDITANRLRYNLDAAVTGRIDKQSQPPEPCKHVALGLSAGFVLANASISSNQSGEGEIRKANIEADLVNNMVALPGQLLFGTQIPVSLWFLAKNKAADAKRGLRDRRKQTLFIDARKLGTLIDPVHRELTYGDLVKITSTYHAPCGERKRLSRPCRRSVKVRRLHRDYSWEGFHALQRSNPRQSSPTLSVHTKL